MIHSLDSLPLSPSALCPQHTRRRVPRATTNAILRVDRELRQDPGVKRQDRILWELPEGRDSSMVSQYLAQSEAERTFDKGIPSPVILGDIDNTLRQQVIRVDGIHHSR